MVDKRNYRIRVEPGSAAWSWSHRAAYLDRNIRLSVMTHEFTHAVTGTEAPGLSGEISEGLSDTYAVIIQQETDHWCYHDYPNHPNQPETDETHVDDSRCQMLARDTVGDVPEWEVSTVKPLVPGIMYNYFANDGHLSGTLYGKVFNLFQVQQWEDPVLGPQTYYNGLPITGEVTFRKTGDLFYRFVQNHLGAMGLQPWNDFGPHFIQAAWLAYLAGNLTKTEYMKAIHALYAVGHRQSPLPINGYLGSRYRPAAIAKNSQIYLFYVDYYDRLTYQRRASGVWTPPVSFTSGAAFSDTGLEAYSLPDGEARVIYRLPGEEEVYFAKILSSGTVPDFVWSFSNAYGCHIPAAYAPSGYHDGREEYIFAATWEKGFTVTRLSDCKVFEYPNIQLGGVSVTQYQGKVYVTGVEGDPSNPRYKHMVTRLWANEQLQDLGFAPDWGYTTCENYTHPDGCFGHKISTALAPVLLGVTMPADRKDFERMYVAYPWDHDRFAITRFHVDVDRQYTPTRRTRMLPVMSGDNHFVTEVELLQSNGYIFAFEGGLMHVIRIY